MPVQCERRFNFEQRQSRKITVNKPSLKYRVRKCRLSLWTLIALASQMAHKQDQLREVDVQIKKSYNRETATSWSSKKETVHIGTVASLSCGSLMDVRLSWVTICRPTKETQVHYWVTSPTEIQATIHWELLKVGISSNQASQPQSQRSLGWTC